MPITGGVFTPIWQWVVDAVTYTTMQPARFDTYGNDVATAINTARFKDGSNTPTANLPMAGFKHTGVGVATLRDQYLTMGQFQDESGIYYADTGAVNAYVITPVPAITAYTAGQSFKFRASIANTGASTINVNGLGAKSLVKSAATALVSGDIVLNKIYEVVYDGTNFQVDVAITGVTLTAPAEFTVTGSGTNSIAITKATESANSVWSGPTTGVAAAPTFRALVAADLPTATTSTQGASQLATTAEVQTGSDASKTVTPATLKGGIGFSKMFTSTEMALTNQGVSNSQAHGLGTAPTLYMLSIRCKTAEFGYAVGDEIPYPGKISSSNDGITPSFDATNIYVAVGSTVASISIARRDTFAGANITNANWRLVVRAWG